jgi:hypothetical protein
MRFKSIKITAWVRVKKSTGLSFLKGRLANLDIICEVVWLVLTTKSSYCFQEPC